MSTVTSATAYSYVAARPDGAIAKGSIEAATDADARRAISDRGLFPISLTAKGEASGRRIPISQHDLALGLRVLGDLLESGLPINRALRVLEDIAPSSWRAAVPAMRDAVTEGCSLGTALVRSPIAIPAVVIGVVHAGESGGTIGKAVMSAAEMVEASAATRAAITGALAYPAVVACAGVGAVSVLMGVVLPRFALILSDLGQELPWSTRMMIAVSMHARTMIWPVLGIGAVGAVMFRVWLSAESGRRAWYGVLLRTPVIGGVRHSAATARVTTFMAALLDAGVPVAVAVALVARAIGDPAIAGRLDAARQRITAGEGIASAFAEFGVLTPTGIRLVRAGEESGRLLSMLGHTARIEQQRSDRAIQALVRLLEPLLLLVFAGVVGLVAAALLQAVYSIRPTA